MKSDPQIQQVQNQIGKVQNQMKDNIEMVMQRQENLDSLADKSSNLQQSASQFSQVASRIREDQQLQQYKFYAGVVFAVVAFILIVSLWGSPGKLILAMIVIGLAASTVFYLMNARKHNSIALAEQATNRSDKDVESGPGTE